MGVFMKKEVLEAEAKRLGVDLTGLSPGQRQGAVIAAKKAAGEPLHYAAKIDPETPKPIQKPSAKPLPDKDTSGDVVSIAPKQTERVAPNPAEQYRGKTLLISPGLKPRSKSVVYDEELGDEIEVEEQYFDIDDAKRFTADLVTGTYRIKGKTGRKVVAQTGLPKYNAKIDYDLEFGLVPQATHPFDGRVGYLWTHQSLPSIKALLQKSGYYHEYRERFQDEPFVWYAGGLLCCDIGFTHSIFAEIQRKQIERKRLKSNG